LPFPSSCPDESTALFHPSRNQCIEDGVGFCIAQILTPPLRSAVGWPPWLPGLFVRSSCRQWPVARIPGQRAKKGGRLGVRSGERVPGCYLGLLSSTPASKIGFCHPSQPSPPFLHWSQLCPPSRAPDRDTWRGMRQPGTAPPQKKKQRSLMLSSQVAVIKCLYYSITSSHITPSQSACWAAAP
jgi:hypothetical protein